MVDTVYALRLALADSGQFALCFFAEVTADGDIYCGMHPQGAARAKTSFLATGAIHLTIDGQRLWADVEPRPSAVSAMRRVFDGRIAVSRLKWDYRPKPESPSRSNLVVTRGHLESDGLVLTLWAVKPGRLDLVDRADQIDREVAAGMVERRLIEVTRPWLLLTAGPVRSHSASGRLE